MGTDKNEARSNRTGTKKAKKSGKFHDYRPDAHARQSIKKAAENDKPFGMGLETAINAGCRALFWFDAERGYFNCTFYNPDLHWQTRDNVSFKHSSYEYVLRQIDFAISEGVFQVDSGNPYIQGVLDFDW